MHRLRTVLFAASAAAMLALSGCAAAEPVEVSADTVVIDVRTAGEYDAGHLHGALNLDLNSGQFAANVPDLDADADYVVYCQSGNRSSQAARLLEDAGLEVVDAGSMQRAAAATGLPVVDD